MMNLFCDAFMLSDRSATAIGVVLLGLALALLVGEFAAPTHGTIAAGGLVVLVAALIVLTRRDDGHLAGGLLAALLLTVALFAALSLFEILQLRKRRAATGASGMVDTLGVVRESLTPTGWAFVNGELWRAVASDGLTVLAGVAVRVVAVRGLTLVVTAAPETETSLPPSPASPLIVGN